MYTAAADQTKLLGLSLVSDHNAGLTQIRSKVHFFSRNKYRWERTQNFEFMFGLGSLMIMVPFSSSSEYF